MVAFVRSMISAWRSSGTSGSIMSMISWGFIWSPPPVCAAPDATGAATRRPRRSGAGSSSVFGAEYTRRPYGGPPVRRVVWFMSGAAGAVAVLVASPDLYTRLREAVAGGPVGGEDDWADHDDTSDVPFAPEE